MREVHKQAGSSGALQDMARSNSPRCIVPKQIKHKNPQVGSFSADTVVSETKADYKGRSLPLPGGNQIAAFVFGLRRCPRAGSQRSSSMGWVALPMARLGAWASPRSSHRARGAGEGLTGAS